jgi:hypothetical protein
MLSRIPPSFATSVIYISLFFCKAIYLVFVVNYVFLFSIYKFNKLMGVVSYVCAY